MRRSICRLLVCSMVIFSLVVVCYAEPTTKQTKDIKTTTVVSAVVKEAVPPTLATKLTPTEILKQPQPQVPPAAEPISPEASVASERVFLDLRTVILICSALIGGLFFGGVIASHFTQKLLRKSQRSSIAEREQLGQDRLALQKQMGALEDLLTRRTDASAFEEHTLDLETHAWRIAELAESLATKLSRAFAASSKLEAEDQLEQTQLGQNTFNQI